MMIKAPIKAIKRETFCFLGPPSGPRNMLEIEYQMCLYLSPCFDISLALT